VVSSCVCGGVTNKVARLYRIVKLHTSLDRRSVNHLNRNSLSFL
jgi:hypothetical protein